MASPAKQKASTTAARIARWRWWFQGGFLLVWLDPLMLRLHGVCSPVFHCYSCPLATFACPIGVLANFSAWHVIPYMTLGVLFVVGALFGSFVCGWACPFGLLQDLLHKIPAPKFRLPNWIGCFRYFTLIGLVVAVPYFYGEKHDLFFCSVCPAGALEAALPYAIAGKVAWPTAAKIAILAGVLGVSLFTWRPWCRIFCPLGAIYGLFDPISVFFLRFRRTDCIECATCRGTCRDLGQPEFSVDGMRCVRCLACSHCRAIAVETVFSRPQKSSSGPLVKLENPKNE
ncbi:MAG: 4Fe-4S binding protein [Pirellulales bacterium]|nr:4Fe-4S binding protein [Pirellulales bacterium]